MNLNRVLVCEDGLGATSIKGAVRWQIKALTVPIFNSLSAAYMLVQLIDLYDLKPLLEPTRMC